MNKMRIAIFDGASAKWAAGGEYTRTQICSILQAVDSLHHNIGVILANGSGNIPALPESVNATSLQCVRVNSSDYLSTAQIIMRRCLGRFWKDPRNRLLEEWCNKLELDVIFHQSPPEWWEHKSVGLCCWIPDFQHIHLPKLFSTEEINIRNEECMRIAEQADIVVLSSESVKKDFVQLAPDYGGKVRVYKFPSQYAFTGDMDKLTATETLKHYGIEKGFFLVVNQFFAHKNHEQIIEAIAKLKNNVDCPQVVMIGQPIDYRDPSGAYLSKLFQMIAKYGVESKIKILGYISREEKDILFRSCRALIQPSRFEGWNTSIEDAKALGCPVLASDIDVHREQLNKMAYGFFDINEPDGLADLILSAVKGLPSVRDLDKEKGALQIARDGALVAGEILLEIAAEAWGFRNMK